MIFIDKAVYAVIFSFSGIFHTQYAQYMPNLINDCRNSEPILKPAIRSALQSKYTKEH